MSSLSDLFEEMTSQYATERIIDISQCIEYTSAQLDYNLTIVLAKVIMSPMGSIYFTKDFNGFNIKYGPEKTVIEFPDNICENVSIVDGKLYFDQTKEQVEKLSHNTLFHSIHFERYISGIAVSRYSAFFDLVDEIPIDIDKYLQGPVKELFKKNPSVIFQI